MDSKALADLRERLVGVIRDEARHYPGGDDCEDRCTQFETECLEGNIHQQWVHNGVIRVVVGSPDRIADVVLPVFMNWLLESSAGVLDE